MPVNQATGTHFPKNPDKFVFDAEVSSVFDNMAERSLPQYGFVNGVIADLCTRLQFNDGDSIWDFGASTGTALAACSTTIRNPLVDFYGVDTSPDMIERLEKKVPLAKAILHNFESDGKLPEKVRTAQMRVAIWNWTLQFLPDESLRRSLLHQTYDALEKGGALVLCEKWAHTSEDAGGGAHVHTTMMQENYLWWRRMNGYTAEEIIAKSRALAGGMWPWSRNDAIDALMKSGFKRNNIFGLYQQFNFGGLVAYK